MPGQVDPTSGRAVYLVPVSILGVADGRGPGIVSKCVTVPCPGAFLGLNIPRKDGPEFQLACAVSVYSVLVCRT